MQRYNQTMAYDDSETEYHLTPEGWIEGSFRSFAGEWTKKEEAPANRILTVIRSVRQSSPYAEEDVSFIEIWKSDYVRAEELSGLWKRFGDPSGRPAPKEEARLLKQRNKRTKD
jgi:hypothetical protein